MTDADNQPISSVSATYVCADCAVLLRALRLRCPECGSLRVVAAQVAREVLGPDWAAIIAGDRRPRGLFDQAWVYEQAAPPLNYLVRLEPLGELAPAGSVVVASTLGGLVVGLTVGMPYKIATRGWVVDLHQEPRPTSLHSCWKLALPGHIRDRVRSSEETKGAAP